MGKNTAQAEQKLHKRYWYSALMRQMVEQWFADFKCKHANANQAKCSDHPILSDVSENIKKLHKFVLIDGKVLLCVVNDTLTILEGSVLTTLREHLPVSKLCLE